MYLIFHAQISLNQLRPDQHQQTKLSLFQIMASRLFDTKTLSEPVVFYFQFDTWEHVLL